MGELPEDAEMCSDSGVVDGDSNPPPNSRSGVRSSIPSLTSAIGFRYESNMDWVATWGMGNNNRSIVITRPSGISLYFNAEAGSTIAYPVGISRKETYLIELLDAECNPLAGENPTYMRLIANDHSSRLFSVESGKVVSVITSSGAIITAEQYKSQVKVTRNNAGEVDQVWCATQGLFVFERTVNSLKISWYGTGQVACNESGEYIVTGDPFKIYSYECCWDGATKVINIINKRAGQSAIFIERRLAGNITTILEGVGDERIVTTYERNTLPGSKWEEIKTVRKITDYEPTSCLRIVKKLSNGGWLTLSKTDAYGSVLAQTTNYLYNEQYRLILETKPDQGYTRYEYDDKGRVILEASPWADGIQEKVIHTEYVDLGINDYRPSRILECIMNEGGAEHELLRTTYTYEDSPQVNRVTEKKQIPSGLTQTSVRETFGEQATNVYSRGRVKMTQAINGIQVVYSYEETSLYDAMWKIISETRVNGEVIPGRSSRSIRYIAGNSTLIREEQYVHTGTTWSKISEENYEYDEEKKRTKKTRGNGRVSITEWMCCGLLREVDEDGVVTSYGYDSARRLIETIRSQTDTTPETITSYTRDAVGRILIEREDVGAMTRSLMTAYDKLGRIISHKDVLGRETTYVYELNGLRTRITLPAGAQEVVEKNYDGSRRSQIISGQYPLTFAYEVKNGIGITVASWVTSSTNRINYEEFDGFNRLEVRFKTRVGSESDYFPSTVNTYNNKGQLVEQLERGIRRINEYDLMGTLSREIRPLSETPTIYNSRITDYSYSYEESEDGVYLRTAVSTYNAHGTAMTTINKKLISELSSILESKTVVTDIYGKTNISWTEYDGATRRINKMQIPTSAITAEAVSVDGYIISEKDTEGGSFFYNRAFTTAGSIINSTDIRGNTVTEERDVGDREIKITDAAGSITTTDYDPVSANPSCITDALGYTKCYKYDNYGRKIVEYGTGIHPACFEYDEANNMIGLTTFRCTEETIITDPSNRTDGDVTTWEYAWQEALLIKKTYANGRCILIQYGEQNRVSSETDARGNVIYYEYNDKTGKLLSINYANTETPDIHYQYNYLGWLVAVTDGSGTRTIAYDVYGNKNEESLLVGGEIYVLKEQYDSYGRIVGYELKKGNNITLLDAAQSYSLEGRMDTAGVDTQEGMQSFAYAYVEGTPLLLTLTMPNGITRETAYEDNRNLPAQVTYRKEDTDILVRTQSSDLLGRPITRIKQRGNVVQNENFTYNERGELTGAVQGAKNYSYIYDNIGNRETVEEDSRKITYSTNNLNQYTDITPCENDSFQPAYDADGNETMIQTESGIWFVVYNVAKRPVKFTQEGGIVVECGYDYMGRRWFKKVIENGLVTKHERYLYRNYLQIAALDILQGCVKHTILWDPTELRATRPLALKVGESLYMYGIDFIKNVTELFDQTGEIVAEYDYAPYGGVTESGDVTGINSIQWSSEVHDIETGFVYYNYRYLNNASGRWNRMDENSYYEKFVYLFVLNNPKKIFDYLGNEGSEDFSGDCCSKALEDPSIDHRGGGGVICCDGKKVACNWTWREDGILDSAEKIYEKCVTEHELKHIPETQDCPCKGIFRPNFLPEYDDDKKKKVEITYTCAEVNCLERSLNSCPDTWCSMDVQQRIDGLKKAVRDMYGGKC